MHRHEGCSWTLRRIRKESAAAYRQYSVHSGVIVRVIYIIKYNFIPPNCTIHHIDQDVMDYYDPHNMIAIMYEDVAAYKEYIQQRGLHQDRETLEDFMSCCIIQEKDNT